ncbi:MAG: hypothetical protein JOZ19_00830 [Rubrobacter sp.]|nr:hypothetical protein [Rubrobacter sp.]
MGWSLPLAFLRPINAQPPSEGRPAGSPHPSQRLRSLKPELSQRSNQMVVFHDAVDPGRYPEAYFVGS